KNSTFTGGTYTFNLRGVNNLVADNIRVIANPNTWNAVVFYTSDSSWSTTATITNSTFSFRQPATMVNAAFVGPQPVYRAVIATIGRGYAPIEVPDTLLKRPPPPTSLSVSNSTIEGPSAGSRVQIPLVHDLIGFDTPVRFIGNTFRGGSYGILAGVPDS